MKIMKAKDLFSKSHIEGEYSGNYSIMIDGSLYSRGVIEINLNKYANEKKRFLVDDSKDVIEIIGKLDIEDI